MKLKDGSLFRQAAYVAGNWVAVGDDVGLTVTNPATSEIIGRVPKLGASETRVAIDAANMARKA